MSARDDVQTAVFRLEGTFDLPAARLLESSLKRMAVGSRVRVDFTRVREFKDFAVAVLAHALRSHGGVDAKVEGLGLHQVRLLRYFGVDTKVFRQDTRPTSS
jgi:hypothetical protein